MSGILIKRKHFSHRLNIILIQVKRGMTASDCIVAQSGLKVDYYNIQRKTES